MLAKLTYLRWQSSSWWWFKIVRIQDIYRFIDKPSPVYISGQQPNGQNSAKYIFVCRVNIWNVNCVQATAFIFDHRTIHLREWESVEVFKTENISSQYALLNKNTFFLTNPGFRIYLYYRVTCMDKQRKLCLWDLIYRHALPYTLINAEPQEIAVSKTHIWI